jgi:3-phosphoshikimate 1-carboxyvinyltransferase
MQQLTATKSGPLRGRVRVPGDKSISHRALMLGAMAIGQTRIEGLLEAADVLATARNVGLLGAKVERQDDGAWLVTGRGLGGFTTPAESLDFGNSGTGARLMMGVVAGCPFEVVFTGDESLSRRPMSRVLNPLKEIGLSVVVGDNDRLPLTLRGSVDLVPCVYELPVASAQVKSAVLLAGLSAPGETTVIEPEICRDHTENMLRCFGARLTISEREDGGRVITLTGQPVLEGRDIVVPGDPSSAAFIAAAALICRGSDVVIENVLINPTRTGFYETLREMGADVTYEAKRDAGGEPVADVRVRAGGVLKGVTVPASRAPSMIDEYPCLAVLAAFAEGETRMEGLGELRVKESDRLAATEAGLRACGVEACAEGDVLIVRGSGPAPAGGGFIETHMDHRIAMAFLTLGLGAAKPVTVDDISMIATSFPSFPALMAGLGAKLSEGGA